VGGEKKARERRGRKEKGREGRGGNVEFHHLLLSNLTTVHIKLCVKQNIHINSTKAFEMHAANDKLNTAA